MFPRFRFPAFAAVLLLGAPSLVRAQQQESELFRRIMNPDRTLNYAPSGKKFEGFGAARGKTASTRGFTSGRATAVKSYQARDFAGSRDFRANAFTSGERAAGAGRKGFAGTDQRFATGEVDVRGSREVRRAVAVTTGDRARPFLVPGKRQKELDEQGRARPLTVEDVRELLNKPRGGKRMKDEG